MTKPATPFFGHSSLSLHTTGTDIPEDYRLSAYTYSLPEAQIAQHPSDRRGGSRLFVVDRSTGNNMSVQFADLAEVLPEGALLVANNSKVLPARLYGRRASGGKVEFLMLTPLPLVVARDVSSAAGWHEAEVDGLVRMSKRVRTGECVLFGEDMQLEVLRPGEFGRCTVRLRWRGELKERFLERGHLPLPPYIRRPLTATGAESGEEMGTEEAGDTAADRERYQTVYARDERIGSVAAPTAGLHFTDALRDDLARRGFGWAEVTLYVGYGTFSPVRCEDIRQHEMHREYLEITDATAAAIARAKAQGRPVVAVGTTSARVLEGAYARTGAIAPFTGWTEIFLYPGSRFHVVDHLITNFHLPESTLLMMVSALTGRKRILDAYAEALSQGFRVFSYGDAMFIR